MDSIDMSLESIVFRCEFHGFHRTWGLICDDGFADGERI